MLGHRRGREGSGSVAVGCWESRRRRWRGFGGIDGENLGVG
jgi:hypothetical protein